ncbi:MAG: L,D-transpeptidase family protein [Hyphomicrobiales bacterium]|nr:L,D-transpeptidase family protein [Hyphomicrobiales bacterium]
MSGPRYERVLASTALALILALPLGAAAQSPGNDAKLAAAPSATDAAAATSTTPEKPATEAPAAPETPAVPPPAASTPAAAPAAATSTVAPDPMAAFDPADRAVAEKLRDLLAAKTDKIFASRKERAAVDTFYKNRNYAPLWLDKGVENARARAAIAHLAKAETEGLDSKDYKAPTLAGSPEALAEADLKLTQVVLTYARHLQAGRFPYTRVSNNNIELAQAPPDPASVLTKVADATDVKATLEQFSPPQEAYQKLKAKLAELRGTTGEEEKIVRVPEGAMLRPGMEDARLPLLRKRLGLSADDSNMRYEGAVVDAVKAFQKGAGMNADGILGATTLRALNHQVAPKRGDTIDLIIANMERWRWYPRDLGNAHVIVNQPDYMLKVMHNGTPVWTTRVVIGKPNMATPLLTETMKYVTINPTWNVPPSIVYNEYLPALQQDPTVLARMGLKVVNNRDGSVHIYQPPGEANALGRIRFNFPNRFLVYQHDTPDKHLFAHDMRAYSHGCMRVQDPAKYAEVLFNIARPSENWTAERVKKMFGTAETDIQLPVPIYVHLTYQSAFVDDAGKLQTRKDIYNVDARTLAAIKSERAMVEPQQERPKEVAGSGSGQRRAAAAVAQQPRSFFEALFGVNPAQAAARPQPPRRVPR